MSLARAVLVAAFLAAAASAPAAQAGKPEDIHGKSFDLVVVEGTPGGIAMAVRSAREGLSVLVVNHNGHPGGILSSGLGVWDTLHEGTRSPIYDEMRQAIFDHYRSTYGENSPQYQHALPGRSGHANGKFEPRVAEKLFDELLAREKRITLLNGFVPAEVQREGALIRAVAFRELHGSKSILAAARIFADCTYEGDLAALAKVPYRVGREARPEFHEPHAGRIFMRSSSEPPSPGIAALAAEHDTLALRKFSGFQEIVLPESTGDGDRHVQAFNYRTILTSDPVNRLPAVQPAHYDPEFLKKLAFGSIVSPIPNRKIGWNRPQLVGPHQAYVEGDWTTRRKVMDEHWHATMALLWFLQNDESVPADKRRYWQQYGLAKDEFPDNGHRPYELYVREARPIVGRYIFTQRDAMLAPGLRRAPIHADSIAATEWYMDAHACTPGKVAGSLDEGKMMLHHETFPGQVPYRALLPQGVDNLLVPVCLSSTHVAWGTIRLEPTWMNIAESAGYAAAQAVRNKQTPAQIDPDELLRTLATRRVMISFFNDEDVAANEAWVPAVEYLGTRGFFSSYDAKPRAPLTEAAAKLWAGGFAQMRAGKLDPNALARALVPLEKADSSPPVTAASFAALLAPEAVTTSNKLNIDLDAPVTRGDAAA